MSENEAHWDGFTSNNEITEVQYPISKGYNKKTKSPDVKIKVDIELICPSK